MFARPACAATCAPPQVVHIITVNITPGVVPGTFSAQPRALYRVGSDKLRIEEALDTPNGIHGLVVVSEPKIWMINLFDNTGKLVVDPGPTFDTKVPLAGAASPSKKLGELELGCEADFIAKYGPAPVRSENMGDARFAVYRIEDGQYAVEILERPGSGVPAFARFFDDGKLVLALRYALYATEPTNNPSLFAPPPGIHLAGASQHS